MQSPSLAQRWKQVCITAHVLHSDLWQFNGGQALTPRCRRPASPRPRKSKGTMTDGGRWAELRVAVMLMCWHGGIVSATSAVEMRPPVWYAVISFFMWSLRLISAEWSLTAVTVLLWPRHRPTSRSEHQSKVPVMFGVNSEQVYVSRHFSESEFLWREK